LAKAQWSPYKTSWKIPTYADFDDLVIWTIAGWFVVTADRDSCCPEKGHFSPRSRRKSIESYLAFWTEFVASFGTMVPTKLHEQARQGIERLITERALTPGSKLPTESNLAGELYVSRTTIRNALNLLEQEGKIERTPGRWAIVRRPHVA
jgi:hypothetical protein